MAVIRALHLSDSHFSDRLRLPDIIEMHRVILERARELRVNLILHAGDFFHARSTPVERIALAEWLQAAAEIAPVFGVRGNHDVAGDLAVFNRLRTKHPVIIEERVTTTAHMLTLEGGDRVGLLGMAWIDKAAMVSGMEAIDDQGTTTNAVVDGMRQLLTCLRAEASRVRTEGAVPILTTHVMIGGSVMSSGQVLIGQGVELSPSDLADVGAAYVACGHVHCTQEFAGGRVVYSGSPVRHNLGEPEAKGFRFVQIGSAGGGVESEFVELPARRIVLLDSPLRLSPELLIDSAFQSGEIPGALVRLRYRVTPEELAAVDEDRLREALMGMGAHEVKLEAIVEQETRVRSEQITAARDTWSKIEAWLVVKGIEIDAPTRERLRTKLAAIEAGQAHEVPA